MGSERIKDLSAIPEVVFSPISKIIVPDSDVSFPAIPSAKYYYLSRRGYRIAISNTIGTIDEQKESQIIWYNMKSEDVFPLKTTYAVGREDQINVHPNDRPMSELSRSMKEYLKQYPDSSGWFFDDRFQILLGQIKRKTINDFIVDFYCFPLNPESNVFMVATLLEQYIRDDDEKPLRNYLEDAHAWHLVDHSFGYYPLYELFFLLTRFASYPSSDVQIQLSKRRNETGRNSPERIFIDSIFNYEIYNIREIFDIIDVISTKGPEIAGQKFGTRFPDWIRWGNEYLLNMNKIPKEIEYLGEKLYQLSDDLYSWTDNQIEELASKYNVNLPLRKEYPARYPWVIQIASSISINFFKK